MVAPGFFFCSSPSCVEGVGEDLVVSNLPPSGTARPRNFSPFADLDHFAAPQRRHPPKPFLKRRPIPVIKVLLLEHHASSSYLCHLLKGR